MFEFEIKDGIIITTLSGTISKNEMCSLFDGLNEREKNIHKRLTILKNAELDDFDFSFLSNLANYRKKEFQPQGKTAVVYDNPLSMGFARMWETLLSDHPTLEVKVFSSSDEAMIWLNK